MRTTPLSITAIVAATLCVSSTAALAQQAPELTTGLAPGPNPVGFRRQWLIDESRSWAEGSQLKPARPGRPIRVDVWYPAVAPRVCEPARLHDYLYAQPPDAYFAAANAHIQKWDESSYRGYAKGTNTSLAAMLALRSAACLNADVAAGRFPVVVYSTGWYNRSPDNVALSAYLASFGYVVAAVPLFGAGLWTGDLNSSPAAIDTQVGDVAAALNRLVAERWVDQARVAAMGYSVGGIVALLLGARDSRVDAVIGLDPSYGGEPAKVLQAASFKPDQFRGSLLTLRSGHETYTVRDRSRAIAALTLANRYTADVGRASHGDFGDDVVIEAALGLVRNGEPRTTAEGIAGYRAVALTVRMFLDGVLRGQRASLDQLPTASPLLRMTVTPAAKGTSGAKNHR